MKRLYKAMGVGALCLSLAGCSSDGIFGSGYEGNLDGYRIQPQENIGGGFLSDGVGLAATARDPEDPKYGTPHFYVAIRAQGSTLSKIVIYDVDTGEPIEKLVIDDN